MTDHDQCEYVLCPHCGLYVDPDWGRCAHDPQVPDWVVKARLRDPATAGSVTWFWGTGNRNYERALRWALEAEKREQAEADAAVAGSATPTEEDST